MTEEKDYQIGQVYRSPLESSMLKLGGVGYKPLFGDEVDKDWQKACDMVAEFTPRPKTLREISGSSFCAEARGAYKALKDLRVWIEKGGYKGPKATPEGLPIVSEHVVRIFGRDMGQWARDRRDPDTNADLMEIARRIYEENPNLDEALSQLTIGKSEEERRGLIYGVLLTYDLLRRQAEADQLEENFNGSC